ncbi:unnamed protein product [Parnassius mnemosyne]|uniref:Uncharacterized protein n=1 Tax=Parnassius mnemosyne TaxID=213953 RepID=A0AAV1M4Z8_9NEOP
MPKRKNEEKIKRYRSKIRKLEQEQRKYKRIIYSSSEDFDKDSDNENLDIADIEPLNSEYRSDKNSALNNEETKYDSDQEPVVSELEPDILTALGETTEETSKLGPKIHDKLAQLWLPILRKGIHKEAKEKLLKEYLIPENCSLLQAPKLNPEISAAVSEGTKTRDKRVEAVQQQLGQGISALNKGLELLLDDGKDRLQAVKFLSDSCRILCDLHFVETEARKKFVTPGLDKSFINIMQEVDRDDLLFGNKLTEKIKATKVIEKHGLQIKKPVQNLKASYPSQQPSTSRSRSQGNWGGPSRFSSNRGGRGGPKKNTLPSRRAPPGTSFQPKPSPQSRHRATTQQH